MVVVRERVTRSHCSKPVSPGSKAISSVPVIVKADMTHQQLDLGWERNDIPKLLDAHDG